MMKRYLSFIALVSLMLLSVISCQKNPDGTPDTPDNPENPGEIHPVPTEGVVDLGLSVLWTTRNVGAVKPTEFGSFFQWAGTMDVTNTDIYLYWNNCPCHTNDLEYEKGWLKYCTIESYGEVDNKTVLEPIDDAAYMSPEGSKWCQRMPTFNEMCELMENCTWTLTTIDDVKGYKVQSNIEGYTDKWIFLPTAGYRCFGEYTNDGDAAVYWTSSLVEDTPYYALALYCYENQQFDKGFDVHPSLESRFYGLPVRPVIEVKKD